MLCWYLSGRVDSQEREGVHSTGRGDVEDHTFVPEENSNNAGSEQKPHENEPFKAAHGHTSGFWKMYGCCRFHRSFKETLVKPASAPHTHTSDSTCEEHVKL